MAGAFTDSVVVRRDFRLRQSNGFYTARFSQIVQAQARPLAGVHKCAALQVWEREIGFAVATVRGAQQ